MTFPMKKISLLISASSIFFASHVMGDSVTFNAYDPTTYQNVEHDLTIKSDNPTYCIEINGDSGFHRAVRLEKQGYGVYSCDTKWVFESVGNNLFNIKPQGTNNCLDIEWVFSNVTDERMGAGARTYKCSEALSQQWKITPLGASSIDGSPVYMYENPYHNSCLTLGSPSSSDKDLVMQPCTSMGTQQFSIPSSEEVCEKAAFIVHENPISRLDGKAVRGHFDGINCIARSIPTIVRGFAGYPEIIGNSYYMSTIGGDRCAEGLLEGDKCYLGTAPDDTWAFIYGNSFYYTPRK